MSDKFVELEKLGKKFMFTKQPKELKSNMIIFTIAIIVFSLMAVFSSQPVKPDLEGTSGSEISFSTATE